jgi:tetratricopeptide (TPR) repeat protein
MKHALLLAALLIVPLSAHPDPRHTLEELDAHLLEKPGDTELLLRKADMLLLTKQLPAAAEIAAKLLETDPDHAEVLLLDARVSLGQGKHEEAATKARSLTARHPRSEAAWKFLARAEEAGGHRPEAIAAMRKHIAIAPKPGPGDALLCATWLQESGDPSAAVTILDQCLAKVGCLSGLQHKAIGIEMELERYDSALRRIDALEGRFRPAIDLSLKRAEILEKAGRFSEAASACDSALALLDALPSSRKRGEAYQQHVDLVTTKKAENERKAGETRNR